MFSLYCSGGQPSSAWSFTRTVWCLSGQIAVGTWGQHFTLYLEWICVLLRTWVGHPSADCDRRVNQDERPGTIHLEKTNLWMRRWRRIVHVRDRISNVVLWRRRRQLFVCVCLWSKEKGGKVKKKETLMCVCEKNVVKSKGVADSKA